MALVEILVTVMHIQVAMVVTPVQTQVLVVEAEDGESDHLSLVEVAALV